MFPVALGCNYHTHIITLREGIYVLHWRGEIDYVELALQIARQFCFKKIDYQGRALLTYVYADTRIGKIDLDATFAIFTAMKIYVTQLMLLDTLLCLSKARSVPPSRFGGFVM